MWKKIVCVILVTLLMFCCVTVNAETIEIGSGSSVIGLDEYTTLDNTLDVCPHTAVIVEKLGDYGEDSGENYQFLYISIDVCNITLEDIDLSHVFTAELTYKDKYTISPYHGYDAKSFANSLIGTWEGTYRAEPERRTLKLEINSIDGEGKLKGVWTFGPLDKKEIPIASYSVSGTINETIGSIRLKGVEWIIDPGNYVWHDNYYLRLIDNNWLVGVADPYPIYLQKVEKNEENQRILGMLEEISYPLVFKVPNRVTSDLDNCKVEIIVNGNRFQISLK